VTEEVPIVTFLFPRAGGAQTGICHMAWQPGWQVKRYLHEQPLRAHSLLGMWKRCRAVNRERKKVKLNYVPPAGDAIVLSRTRAMS